MATRSFADLLRESRESTNGRLKEIVRPGEAVTDSGKAACLLCWWVVTCSLDVSQWRDGKPSPANSLLHGLTPCN